MSTLSATGAQPPASTQLLSTATQSAWDMSKKHSPSNNEACKASKQQTIVLDQCRSLHVWLLFGSSHFWHNPRVANQCVVDTSLISSKWVLGVKVLNVPAIWMQLIDWNRIPFCIALQSPGGIAGTAICKRNTKRDEKLVVNCLKPMCVGCRICSCLKRLLSLLMVSMRVFTHEQFEPICIHGMLHR